MTTAAICPTWGVLRGASYYRAEQYDSDLGLYYFRARYYNPATGRFSSRDPENGIVTDPKTLHKYDYAGGDPVNGADPTGRATTANGWFGGAAGEYTGVSILIAVRNTVAVAAAEVCSLNRDAELIKGVASDITQPVQAIEFGVCSAKVGKCKRCYPVRAGEWAYDLDWGQQRDHWFKKSKIYVPPGVAHYHLLQMNQSPYPDCKCGWNRFNGGIGGLFPPGPPANLEEAVPARGGGPEEF